ncbi:DUF58 domain-containing protein [soil metagenome]
MIDGKNRTGSFSSKVNPAPCLAALFSRWARRRQGLDGDHVVLHRRRVYILPTPLGAAYAVLLLAMLLGSMNYGSSLGLALTFLLAGVGIVAMHYCHRNIVGIELTTHDAEPVFAGQSALFPVLVFNPSRGARYELWLDREDWCTDGVDIGPGKRARLALSVPAHRRGAVSLGRYRLSSSFPLGLFRAWAWVHIRCRGIVFPRPARPSGLPPPRRRDTGGAQLSGLGEDDFAGLRSFRAGDSPRHVAWKAFAREHELLVKQYAGTAVEVYWFAWRLLPAGSVEERLSQLCRWILDAHADGHAFGLELPAARIGPGIDHAHRQRCLSLLALFEPPGASP